MQGSPELVVAVKDAEISMLRQQLAQLSAEMNRNIAVLSAKENEAAEARNAVNSLTAVLSEKDAVSPGVHSCRQQWLLTCSTRVRHTTSCRLFIHPWLVSSVIQFSRAPIMAWHCRYCMWYCRKLLCCSPHANTACSRLIQPDPSTQQHLAD